MMPTIGECIVDSLSLFPEQWSVPSNDSVFGKTYHNKANDWTLTRFCLPLTGSRSLSFGDVALTWREKRRVHRALDDLDNLLTQRGRSLAVTKYLARVGTAASAKR